jgi:hypothetical protein
MSTKIKSKPKQVRAPGGGRRQLIEGVELIKISLLLPQAQIDYLESKGAKGSRSDGARSVITRDMARDLEGSNGPKA